MRVAAGAHEPCDNDEDLYSLDYPELARQGVRISDILGPPESAGAEHAVLLDYAQRSKSPDQSLPNSPERDQIVFSRVLEATHQQGCEQARWEKEIQHREEHLTHQIWLSEFQQQSRFLPPLSAALPLEYKHVVHNIERNNDVLYAGLLSQLARFPDLLHRYFQSERKIIQATRPFRQMRLCGQTDWQTLVHAESWSLRLSAMLAYPQQYAQAVAVLMDHIDHRLCTEIANQVCDLDNDEPLTMVDDLLMTHIISRDRELLRRWTGLREMEQEAFSWRKWAGGT